MPAATARKQQDGLKAELDQEELGQAQISLAPFLGEKQRSILRKGMCRSLSDEHADHFFECVERTQLDPFQSQIWPSVRQSKDPDGNRHPTLHVLVQLQGLRAIGDRSLLSDGEDPVEWIGEDGIWKPEWLLKVPPIAARARVYRKDRTRPQTVVCRWDGYCQFVFDRSGQEIPNAIWKRLGPHMLGKCALAGCYRGLWPRQASGVYITEELGEGSDGESEAAIEAEMTRRYAREAEYWEAEKAKGHYPVGQEPAKAPEPGPVAETTTLKSIIRNSGDPLAPGWVNLGAVQAAAAQGIAAPADESIDWRTFLISRIRIFEGRTVGSLTENEVEGLTPWLERVSAKWGTLDNDVKNHYTAVVQRKEYDKAHAVESAVDDELQLGLEVR